MSKIEIQSAKREQKRYRDLIEHLEVLKTDVEEEGLPMPMIDQSAAAKTLSSIEMLITLAKASVESLECHIDDLINEEGL